MVRRVKRASRSDTLLGDNSIAVEFMEHAMDKRLLLIERTLWQVLFRRWWAFIKLTGSKCWGL